MVIIAGSECNWSPSVYLAEAVAAGESGTRHEWKTPGGIYTSDAAESTSSVHRCAENMQGNRGAANYK